MGNQVTRRTYLEALLATGAVASIAGCNSSQDTSPTNSSTNTQTATVSGAADTPDAGTTTNSPTDTQTATPNQAPQILAHNATPQDNGTSLAVHLEGEDDHGIQTAVIQYGEKELRETPNDTEIILEDELTGLEDAALENSPGQVRYRLQDTDGKETRAEVHPDESPPELRNFSAEPTESAGKIDLVLDAKDGVGLEEVQLLLGGQPQLQENVSGQQEHRTDQDVAVSEDARFQRNTVTASLEDWNGNTTESEAETYVRKYDVMEDTRLDVGAVYIPFAGLHMTDCVDGRNPRVGQYDDPIPPEITSRHIDQMQGHGVNTLMFNFGEGRSDYERYETFLESDLSDKMDIEAFYVLSKVQKRDRDIDEDFEFMRENMLNKDNYETINGRPVVTFWGASASVFKSEYNQEIKNEYGGHEEFVNYIRDGLTVNGTDPYLVADMAGGLYSTQLQPGDGELAYSDLDEFTSQYDGVTTWTARAAEGWDTNANQEETLEWVEENWTSAREYTDANDMDLIPMVHPGFDDRGNSCWGGDRYTPRGPEYFERLLSLADEYRTTEKVYIATWNAWTEGTQIEPGSFRGTDYGTEYVEIVQEFQNMN